jgi:hypothetical protein
MRSVTLALLVVCAQAHAQEATPPAPERAPQPSAPAPPPLPPEAVPTYAQPPMAYGSLYVSPDLMYRSGRRQRAVGIALTSVGIGLAVVAGALVYNMTRTSDLDLALTELGAVLVGGTAVGCIIPGVILWDHGEEKMDQALQMGARPLSFVPTLRVVF